MKKASFTLNFDSDLDSRLVHDAIIPEIKHKIPKTDVKISVKDKKLVLKIVARDTSSLRAAVNSYLRWIITAVNVNKTL